MRRWGLLVATGLSAAVCAAPRVAAAQAMPPADREIDIEDLDNSIGPKKLL